MEFYSTYGPSLVNLRSMVSQDEIIIQVPAQWRCHVHVPMKFSKIKWSISNTLIKVGQPISGISCWENSSCPWMLLDWVSLHESRRLEFCSWNTEFFTHFGIPKSWWWSRKSGYPGLISKSNEKRTCSSQKCWWELSLPEQALEAVVKPYSNKQLPCLGEQSLRTCIVIAIPVFVTADSGKGSTHTVGYVWYSASSRWSFAWHGNLNRPIQWRFMLQYSVLYSGVVVPYSDIVTGLCAHFLFDEASNCIVGIWWLFSRQSNRTHLNSRLQYE